MAYYKVGPDNSSFFSKRTTWELLDAINVAVDGDIIEVDNSYVYNSENVISINKSISIIGKVDESENNQLQPIIINQIHIDNGVTVTIKNFSISINKEKTNAITIKDKSALIGENLFIENTSKKDKLYPIIGCVNSNLKLIETSILANNLGVSAIYAKDSNLNIYDSSFEAKLEIENSTLFISNTDFKDAFLKIILRLFFAYEDRKEDLICTKKMFIHLF